MALLEITDESTLLDLTNYPASWDDDNPLHVLAVISPQESDKASSNFGYGTDDQGKISVEHYRIE